MRESKRLAEQQKTASDPAAAAAREREEMELALALSMSESAGPGRRAVGGAAAAATTATAAAKAPRPPVRGARPAGQQQEPPRFMQTASGALVSAPRGASAGAAPTSTSSASPSTQHPRSIQRQQSTERVFRLTVGGRGEGAVQLRFLQF